MQENDKLLEEAIEIARAGRRQEAHAILGRLVDQNADNEQAWLWYALTSDDEDEAIGALRYVLTLNPASSLAREALQEIEQNRRPSASPAPAVPFSGPPPQVSPADTHPISTDDLTAAQTTGTPGEWGTIPEWLQGDLPAMLELADREEEGVPLPDRAAMPSTTAPSAPRFRPPNIVGPRAVYTTQRSKGLLPVLVLAFLLLFVVGIAYALYSYLYRPAQLVKIIAPTVTSLPYAHPVDTVVAQGPDSTVTVVAQGPAPTVTRLPYAAPLTTNTPGLSGGTTAAQDNHSLAETAADEAQRDYQKGDYASAIHLLEGAVAQDPENVRAHYSLGLTYIATGQLDQAADQFQHVTQLAPAWAGGYSSLGELYRQKGSLTEAVYWGKRGVQLDPNSAEHWLWLAQAYSDNNQSAEAQFCRDQSDAIMKGHLIATPTPTGATPTPPAGGFPDLNATPAFTPVPTQSPATPTSSPAPIIVPSAPASATSVAATDTPTISTVVPVFKTPQSTDTPTHSNITAPTVKAVTPRP